MPSQGPARREPVKAALAVGDSTALGACLAAEGDAGAGESAPD